MIRWEWLLIAFALGWMCKPGAKKKEKQKSKYIR